MNVRLSQFRIKVIKMRGIVMGFNSENSKIILKIKVLFEYFKKI